MPYRIEGEKGRLALEDSIEGMVDKLSDGNPGAINVVMMLMMDTRIIEFDPQNTMGGYGYISMLDMFGIYGKNIWYLYKYLGDGDLGRLLTLIRGLQLGELPAMKIERRLQLEDGKLPVPPEDVIHFEELLERVQRHVPSFQPEFGTENETGEEVDHAVSQ